MFYYKLYKKYKFNAILRKINHLILYSDYNIIIIETKKLFNIKIV